MNCPVCNSVSLVMSERQGIEIDYCPQCRGVWLDRGELDKIIDRSLSAAAPVPVAAPAPAPRTEMPSYPNQHSQSQHSQSHHAPQHGGYYKKKKREGFLSELFDFD